MLTHLSRICHAIVTEQRCVSFDHLPVGGIIPLRCVRWERTTTTTGDTMNRKQRERERELWDNWEREQMERPRTAPQIRGTIRETIETFYSHTTHQFETMIVFERVWNAPDGITHRMRM